jgi:cyclophilin family peptidyl-prolyl cis-trans isomerase
VHKSKLNIFASVFLHVINQFKLFMNRLKKYSLIYIALFLLISCSTSTDNKNSFVLIKTTLGDITVRLYDETPVHRDNFIYLVNNRVFEGISFHRVIKDFMIQAGDPETKAAYIKKTGDTLTFYTIPSEFNPQLFHKKGALAAAREGDDVNPEMRSSGTQFYIVQGVIYSDDQLNQVEQRINNKRKQVQFASIMKQVSDSNRISGSRLSEAEIQERVSLRMFETLLPESEYKIPEARRNVYKTLGGVPRLDGSYTVFGEVVMGLDIVDKIAGVQTNENDKPLTDIRILKTKHFHK